MNNEHKFTLKNKRDILSNSIKLEDIRPLLVDYKIFNRYMWNDITSTADMLDALPFRGPKAFGNIIEILRKAKYFREADLLEGRTLAKETLDNMFYVMSSKPLGFCLIINNVEFEKLESENGSNVQLGDRFGSDVDANSLHAFFKRIDFDVTIERNMKADEMVACLREFSRRDFTNVDSLIIIILSHGSQLNNKDIIYGTDHSYIFKSDICDIFSNRNCQQLQNKPKMFFFICCRGESGDYGVPKCLPNESIDSSEIIMPSLSDVFVVHSTLPKQVSVRDFDKGSLFCDEFITVLNKYSQTHDLETMIKLVNKNLQNRISRMYCVIQVAHMEVLGGTKKIMLCKTMS